jgi:ribonuclease P protein component
MPDASAPPDPGLPPVDRGLSRRQRLTASSAFAEAYARGRKFVGRHMVLWVSEGAAGALRLGVVSSRRVGAAHERNRARRRLRETYRVNRHRLSGRADVVLVARSTSVDAPFADLEREFLRLAQRAGLLSGAEARGTEETPPAGRGRRGGTDP